MASWLYAYINARTHLLLQYGIGATMNSHDCDDVSAGAHRGCCETLEPDTHVCLLNGVIHVCSRHRVGRFEDDETGIDCPYVDRRHVAKSIVCSHTSQPVFTTMFGDDKTEILQTAEETVLGEKDRLFMKSQQRSRTSIRIRGSVKSEACSRKRHDLMDVAYVESRVAVKENEEALRQETARSLEIFRGLYPSSSQQTDTTSTPSQSTAPTLLDSIVLSMTREISFDGSIPPPTASVEIFREYYAPAWNYEPVDRTHYFQACHLLPRVESRNMSQGLSYSSKIPYASSQMKAFCAIHNCVPQDYFWDWYAREWPLQGCSAEAIPCIKPLVENNARMMDYHMRKYAKHVRKACPVKAINKSRTCPVLRISTTSTSPTPVDTQEQKAMQSTLLSAYPFRFQQPDPLYVGLHRDILSMRIVGAPYLQTRVFPMTEVVNGSTANSGTEALPFEMLVYASRVMQLFSRLKNIRLECARTKNASASLPVTARGVGILLNIVTAIDDQLDKIFASLDQSISDHAKTAQSRKRNAASDQVEELSLFQLGSLLAISRESGFGLELRKILERPSFLQRCFFLVYLLHLDSRVPLDPYLSACKTDFSRLYRDLTCVVDRVPSALARLTRSRTLAAVRQHPLAFQALYSMDSTDSGKAQKRNTTKIGIRNNQPVARKAPASKLEVRTAPDISNSLPPAKRRRILAQQGADPSSSPSPIVSSC